ncbi:hypothetical protein QM012_004038 [Aureobasidium pullulans]|uniref:NAD(P)-binding protein n=1 Tax=Aureobasidium pullulans TaxID=5580 RepID=A0ABR0T7T3_AURPU
MPSGAPIVFFSIAQWHASTVTLNYILYAVTKAAVEQIVRVRAKTLGPKGVFVNAVAQGPTAADMVSSKPQEVLDKIVSFNDQIVKSRDVADAIVF